jgi:hypothetical protein
MQRCDDALVTLSSKSKIRATTGIVTLMTLVTLIQPYS